MLEELVKSREVYLFGGYTDMRKGIQGLILESQVSKTLELKTIPGIVRKCREKDPDSAINESMILELVRNGQMNRTDYSLLFKLTTPLIIAATESASTASMIAALVMADKVSISELSLFIFTMISVFCNVRTDTSASMKLIVRSRRTSLSDDLFLLLR